MEPVIFRDSIHPCDIQSSYPLYPQFVSAVYCLCEKPYYIERLFQRIQFNTQAFRVSLCIFGKWRQYTIDSFFPYKPLEGPFFMHGLGSEIWPQILEQALAKSAGGYFEIKKMTFTDILFTLTGCPMRTINLNKQLETKDIQKSWDELKGYLNKGYLILFSQRSEEEDDMGCGEINGNHKRMYSYCLKEMEIVK